MTEKEHAAAALFDSGFNCAQSVLAVFCEKYGLPQKTALKASSGLGGGVRCAEICGAVSGAVLVIGLKNGQHEADDTFTKTNCNAITEEFVNRFKKSKGSVICRDILGCDISTKQGREQAVERDLFRTTCAEMVKSAVRLLEQMDF